MGRIRRVLNICSGEMERQLTDSDCAVWVIKAICFQLGVSVPPANQVRRYIEIENGGTSIRCVRDALGRFGVSGQPVQGPTDAIAKAPLPAIALVELESTAFHYVIVLEANQNHVKYLDPGVGGFAQTIDAKQFESMFTGCLVLCTRQPGYVAIDFEKEVDPQKFLIDAIVAELNPALAMAIGEIFQLLVLLIGILMLKNFFGSSMLGMPNFWFLAGIAVCGFIYMWIGKMHQSIQAEVKSRTLLSLLDLATRLIKDFDFARQKGIRETSSRCLSAASSVANSIATVVVLPGNTVSLVLFITLMAWIDLWAAGYAVGLAVSLPLFGLWQSRKIRMSKREVARHKERNEVGFVYLMAQSDPDTAIVSDLPWSQLAFCDALAKYDSGVSTGGVVAGVVCRLSVFVGLLIGGLQHAEYGMGHTIAVFFLLSIYSSVVSRWAKRFAAIPDNKHQIRALLDFFSDLTNKPLKYSTVVSTNSDERDFDSCDAVEGASSSTLEIGGVV